MNSARLCESLRCPTWRRGRAILAGVLGGPDGINSLAVFPSTAWKTAFHFIVREIEESVSRLRAIHRVSQLDLHAALVDVVDEKILFHDVFDKCLIRSASPAELTPPWGVANSKMPGF